MTHAGDNTGEHSKYTSTPLSHGGRDKTSEHSEYTGILSHAGRDKTGEHSEYTGTPSSHAGGDKTGEHSRYTGTPLSQAGGNIHVSKACCLQFYLSCGYSYTNADYLLPKACIYTYSPQNGKRLDCVSELVCL